MWACGSGSKNTSATATPGCAAAALTGAQDMTEAAGLNAALALEYEAINIYTAAAGISAIWTAEAHPLAPTFLMIAKQFLGQHEAHAAALVAAIEAVNGTAVTANPAATDLAHYPAAIGSLTGASGLYTILGAAAERELNAANAYFGLVNALQAQSDCNLVASIAPDEAAHYGVLVAAAFAVSQTASPTISTPLTPANIVPTAVAGLSPRK
jgi:rubrerythrin